MADSSAAQQDEEVMLHWIYEGNESPRDDARR